jgi:hypothetical protein
MFRLPLRWRRERLRRWIVLPLRLRSRRRNVIVGTPYRLARCLTVVTGTINIASAIACAPSRLVIDYLRTTVAIDVRLWLLWRNVSSRHSCHIVIGQHAPAVSVSIGTADVGVTAIAIPSPVANRPCRPSARSPSDRRFGMNSVRRTLDNTPVCRRNRRTEARRRVRQPRPAVPSVPAARRPAPAASVHKYPLAVAIRHPAPGIRRNPCVSKARRVAPVAVAERVPTNAHVVRLPDVAVSRRVIILAVIIQVTRSILVR